MARRWEVLLRLGVGDAWGRYLQRGAICGSSAILRRIYDGAVGASHQCGAVGATLMASTPHLVWALRQRDLTAAERLVLIYLADRANGAMVCWPMIATIAEALELSERSVMRAVQTLEDKDLIRVDRRHRQFNHYHILRPENGSDPEAEHPEPCVTEGHSSDVRVTQSQSSVTESHPTSVTESHPSVTACHPSEAERGDTQSPKPPFLG